MIAVQDASSEQMSDGAYDALGSFGAINPLKYKFRNSYALLGYSGPGELDAVTQVIRERFSSSLLVFEYNMKTIK